jgi:uncharacterized protein DUF2877
MGASPHAAVLAEAADDNAFPALSFGVRVPTHGAAKVHSLFDRAANLELAGQRLVVLLDATSPNVPHGIRLGAHAWRELRASVRVGDTLAFEGGGLRFARTGWRVDLSGARGWHVDLSGTHAGCGDARVVNGLAAASAIARTVHVRAGDPVAAAYSRRLARVKPPLESAIRQLSADTAIDQLHRLLGVGCGLTPAGDDFIVGCLAGLAIGTRYEAERRRFLMDVAGGLDFSATTLISRQHLSDACHLQFAQPLAELAVAITVGAADVLSKLEAALAVGASSGADGVAGLLFGLQAWLPLPQPCSAAQGIERERGRPTHEHRTYGHAA